MRRRAPTHRVPRSCFQTASKPPSDRIIVRGRTLVARTSSDSTDRAKNLALIQSTRAGARIFTPVLSGYLFERSRAAAVAPGALPYLLVASLVASLVPVPLVLRRFEDSSDRAKAA